MKQWACLLCASTAALTAHAEFDAIRLWVNAGFYLAYFDNQKGLHKANPGIGLE